MDHPILLICGLDEEILQDLGSRGYRVETADDYYRALELSERVKANTVVIRTGLPGPEPADVIRKLKGAAPRRRLVVAAQTPEADAAAEVLQAGADAVALMPVGVGFLLWTLDRIAENGVVLDPQIARSLVESLTHSVTREREWARALAEQARQAEGLAQAKTDFLANLSHELRTPLTIIKGVAATLGRLPDAVSEDHRSALLSEVELAADRLSQTFEELLAQAEIHRGEFALNFQPCDVAEIVHEGAKEAGHRYRKIQVELLLPATIPAVADARALRGVVRQLVDNACRYSEEEGTVTVKAGKADEGVTVHITDRGSGVARDKVAAAFGGAFSPGEGVLNKERAGLGVGLNLARNLVALHGGILWAEPLPGGGSRVSFTIPAQRPSDGPDGTDASAAAITQAS